MKGSIICLTETWPFQLIALYPLVDQGLAAIIVYLSVLQLVSDVIRLAFIRYYDDKQRHIGPILLGQSYVLVYLWILSPSSRVIFYLVPKSNFCTYVGVQTRLLPQNRWYKQRFVSFSDRGRNSLFWTLTHRNDFWEPVKKSPFICLWLLIFSLFFPFCILPILSCPWVRPF